MKKKKSLTEIATEAFFDPAYDQMEPLTIALERVAKAVEHEVKRRMSATMREKSVIVAHHYDLIKRMEKGRR